MKYILDSQVLRIRGEISSDISSEYGGSYENRMRFPLELLNSVRDSVGDEFIIIPNIGSIFPL